MNLIFTFSEENPVKPRISVGYGDKLFEIKRERWIQFLSLLTYRLLSGIEDGWVILEDISLLAAFQKAQPKVIGKYLATSRFEFPQQVTKFLNRTMDLTTTGPYKLMLGRNNIITDLYSLEGYLNYINLRPKPPRTDGQSLWQAAQLTFDKYELKSCMEILQRFIMVAEGNENIAPYQLPLAYIRLVRVERLSRKNTIDISPALETAKKLAAELTSPYERNILMAYALAVDALTHAKHSDSYDSIRELNQQSIQLLKAVPETTPDTLCLLGAIYYNNYSSAIFNQGKSYNAAMKSEIQCDLSCALDYYKQMLKLGKPQIVNVEDGIVEGIKLLSVLIHRVLDKEKISEVELNRYEDLLETRSISKLLTLIQGEWIRRHYLSFNRLENAYNFGQKCLIDHAQLHETAAFQSMVEQQKLLKQKLSQIEKDE